MFFNTVWLGTNLCSLTQSIEQFPCCFFCSQWPSENRRMRYFLLEYRRVWRSNPYDPVLHQRISSEDLIRVCRRRLVSLWRDDSFRPHCHFPTGLTSALVILLGGLIEDEYLGHDYYSTKWRITIKFKKSWLSAVGYCTHRNKTIECSLGWAWSRYINIFCPHGSLNFIVDSH